MRLDHERVHWHRDRLGWTLETLAEKAEVAKGTVLRAEHGEDVRPGSGRRIAQALGAELSDLIPDKPGRVEELVGAGKAEAPEAGPTSQGPAGLPEWATTSALDALFDAIEGRSTEELREECFRRAEGLSWSRTLEDLKGELRHDDELRKAGSNEPRKAVTRVLNQADIFAIREELLRRGEEPPEKFVPAFRQWLKAITPSTDAETQSETSRRASEAS